jgi:gliding motility-associated-like protein
MKKVLLFLILFICFERTFSQQFGHFASATFVQTCYGTKFYNNSIERATPDCINPTCDTIFHLKNFGKHYKNSGNLILKGGELKTFRGNNSIVCGSRMYYVVYPIGNRPNNPNFNQINLPFRSNCTMDNDGNGTPDTFGDSYGPCSGNDQKWNNMDQDIDLTNFNVGSYALEIYFDVTGQQNGTSNCNDTVLVINSGNNFIGFFQILEATITADGPTTFCQGESVNLSSSFQTGTTWSTGSNNQSINANSSGTFSITTPSINLCNTTDNASISITVNPLPNVTSSSDLTICKGETVTLNASGADIYVWNDNLENGMTINLSENTSFTVIGTNSATNCSNTASFSIIVVETPQALIGTNSTNFTPNSNIVFFNNSTNANSYIWNFDNGSNSLITYDLSSQEMQFEEGNYVIKLTASNGVCEDTDSILILILPEPQIEIPNIFTVNDDGDNDLFFIKSANLSEFNISILNRWGSVMFESKDANFTWDGKYKNKKVTEGTYFYIYQAKGIDNKELNGQGFITIIVN